MADAGFRGTAVPARAWRRRGRRLPWLRRDAVASAAALAALFSATGCGSDEGSAGSTITSVAPATDPSTTLAAVTSVTTSPPITTSPATTARTIAPATTRPTTGTTATPATTAPPTSSNPDGPRCVTAPDGRQSCLVPGRPLRRLWRLLLPAVEGPGTPTDEARAEYASVAAFGELALRLLAVGAPADLVAACHQAALDEIRHARVCGDLSGATAVPFGAIPGLLGHRLGGWRRSRRLQLQRLAVESMLDGWMNEGAAAAQLRARARAAATEQERSALSRMADDEQRHADLARAIVTWCFDEEPKAVGRALGRAAPLPTAA